MCGQKTPPSASHLGEELLGALRVGQATLPKHVEEGLFYQGVILIVGWARSDGSDKTTVSYWRLHPMFCHVKQPTGRCAPYFMWSERKYNPARLNTPVRKPLICLTWRGSPEPVIHLLGTTVCTVLISTGWMVWSAIRAFYRPKHRS